MPTVSSASQIILSLTSAQIVKGWPAFTSSVVEFLWRGTMCYLLLNCPAIDHLPGLPNLFYFFIPSIPISLETVCLEHSLHTPPQLPLPSRVSCPGLQAHLWLLAGATVSHHPAPPELVWFGLSTNFLNPEGLSFDTLRSHFCLLTEFGQMLMNNDNSCFFCRLRIFTCRSWARKGTRKLSSAHCSLLGLKEESKPFWNPCTRDFNLTLHKIKKVNFF